MHDLADAEHPYPSTVRPVVGRNMVISSQPLASQAGLRILELGGNAVDAAIATAAAIAVVEPTNNGIGGDAFAAVWDGSTLTGLNASGRAPRCLNTARMREKYGARMPELGWDSVTVPGAVSAWTALWQRYGSVPFEKLMASAIGYAANGFSVSPGVARKWSEQADKLRGQPNFAKTFLPNDRAPTTGQCFVQPDLAETLSRIAHSVGQDFYTGVTASRIAAFASQSNGRLSKEDLATHQADWTDMLHVDYRRARICEMPPNGQGLIALYALAILEHFEIEKFAADSVQSIHLQIEAIKLAFAQVQGQLGDPELMNITAQELLQPARVRAAASLIDPVQAQNYQQVLPALAGTVFLTTGDASGRMVSMIQSNYMGFGSGVVVPGTGVALQNRGAGFSLDQDSPARLAPGARPFHTILPGFLFGNDGSRTAFGATGGAFQPQGHVQLVVRLISFLQNPQAVVDAPRFKVSSGLQVSLEPGFPQATVQGLMALGHEVVELDTSTWDFGGMQILKQRKDHYIGARDARRDSHVAVF